MPYLFPTTDWSTVSKAFLDTAEGLAALESVCDRYREPVVRYLESVLRSFGLDPSLADDVAQDWFVRTIENRSMFEPGRIKGKFGAYVRRCALQELFTYLRKQQRHRRGGKFRIESLESHPRLQDEIGEDSFFDMLCAERHMGLAYQMVEALWRERGKHRQWEALRRVLEEDATLDDARHRLGLTSVVTVRGLARQLRAEVTEALELLDKAKPGDPELQRWLALLANRANKDDEPRPE